MSNKQSIATFFDSRLARRLVLGPLAIMTAVIGIVLSPVLVLGAAVTDLACKQRRLPRVRLGLLLLGAMIIESIAMFVSFVIWGLTGFGFAGTARSRWHMHRNFMGHYTHIMLGLVTRILGTKIIWRDHADLSSGPVVLIARHTSFFDALIPAVVLSQRNRLLAHHVVTYGLRYSPCIDIVGHRLPNFFVRRTPGEGSSDLQPIEAVGAVLDERSAAVIFPEGTFRTPDRFERAVRRIRRRQPELADRADRLNHILPPRASGTFALLQGAPDADIVVCTNTGFELFGSINQILNRPYTDDPIVIETWRIARSEIPDDFDEFSDWLFNQYARIDDWVAEVHAEH